ncbi:MAG: ABC transporter ATP-binding protein [Solimonas sp.]
MIRVQDLSAGYGRINVLKGVSLQVGAGELVSVVGANGAGKSTLVRCIQGLLQPASGRIEFEGRDITRLPAEQVVRQGLCLVPETRELFADLSVTDNLFLGAYVHRKEEGAGRRRAEAMQTVFSLFPALQERQTARASNLSGGQQQMLAIGRALMARPRALMLDEPSLGLSPLLVQQIFEAIATLRQSGLAIVLIEQNVRAALKLADRAYVLQTGSIIAEGRAETLAGETVMKAYLGKGQGKNKRQENEQRRTSERHLAAHRRETEGSGA